MPTYQTPGVYLEELPSGVKPILGVSTSTACFIGVAQKGPIGLATFISSFQEFAKIFGGPIRIVPSAHEHYLYYMVQHFFQEGGTRCYVVRVAHYTDIDDATTLTATPTSLTIDGRNLDGSSAGTTLRITAINTGTWGDSLQVQIVNSSKFSLMLEEDIPESTSAVPLGKTTISLAGNSDVQVGSLLWIVEEVTGTILSVNETAKSVKFQANLVSGGQNLNGTLPDNTLAFTSVFTLTTETNGSVNVVDGVPTSDIVLDSVTTVTPDPINPTEQIPLKNRDVVNFVLKQALVEVKKIGHKIVNGKKMMTVDVDFGTQTFSEFDKSNSRVYARDFTINVMSSNTVVESHASLSFVDTNATDYVDIRLPGILGRASYFITASDENASNDILIDNTAFISLGSGTPGNDGLTNFADADIIGSELQRTGIYALDLVTDGSILVIPNASQAVSMTAISYVEKRQDMFYVMDHHHPLDRTAQESVIVYRSHFSSSYAAIYYPWIKISDPFTRRPVSVPPSGAVAGIYADTDGRRGVHKAPAGIDTGYMNVASGIDQIVTKGENDVLYQAQVNVIRKFPEGIIVWGARTTTSDTEWIYVNVRRLFIFLEQSIEQGTKWTVFEPNDRTLWKSIRRNVSAFLRVQWIEGKLVGDKEEKAFYVKCDEETNPQEVIDAGQVITEIGVAPSKPAEFVVFRIRQFAGGTS